MRFTPPAIRCTAISDEDYDLLEGILGAYQAALDLAQGRLEGLGYHPTTTVKTTTTLIEKLIREQSMKMKGVQDIAGARIVVGGGRLDQNAVVGRVVGARSVRCCRTCGRRSSNGSGTLGVGVCGTRETSPVVRR